MVYWNGCTGAGVLELVYRHVRSSAHFCYTTAPVGLDDRSPHDIRLSITATSSVRGFESPTLPLHTLPVLKSPHIQRAKPCGRTHRLHCDTPRHEQRGHDSCLSPLQRGDRRSPSKTSSPNPAGPMKISKDTIAGAPESGLSVTCGSSRFQPIPHPAAPTAGHDDLAVQPLPSSRPCAMSPNTVDRPYTSPHSTSATLSTPSQTPSDN